MNLKSIKPGTKFEINIVNSLGEKTGYSYVSQLEDVIDETHIVIASPICSSRVILLAPGTRLKVFFIEQKFGLLSFNASVQAREQRENFSILVLEIEGSIERIQRRNFYRLDIVIDAYYRQWQCDECIDNVIKPDPDLSLFKKCITKNLSGTGLCTIVSETFPQGSDLQLVVPLNNYVIDEKCIIVRCIKTENFNISSYELGLHFTNMSKTTHDEIIKYVFQKQRYIMEKNMHK